MRTGALAYFVVVLVWSCAFWAAAVASGGADATASPLFLVGGAGPFLAAVVLTQVRESPATRRDFWVRIFDPRRLHGRWWAAALLLHPALVGLAVATDRATGGAPPDLHAPESALGLLGLVFTVFWFGPLPEEIGWRGFALDRLLHRTTALLASLVLGAVWALWHVPLFFVPGSFQAGLGPGSPRFWIFLADLLPLSVLITWIYVHTSRSTLSAVLVHFSGNLCGAIVPKTDRLAGLELLFLSAAAILVTLSGGLRTGSDEPAGDARGERAGLSPAAGRPIH